MTTNKDQRAAAGQPVPALEWIAAALGGLILIALCGILLREVAAGGDGDVPQLTARVERVTPTPGGFVADIVVANAARQTASAVEVEASLGDERASATLDYVPGRSEARAGLVFRADPRAAPLELAVRGYQLP